MGAINKLKSSTNWFQLILIAGILIAVNILANSFYAKWDLTAEKRFTLTEPTKNLLKGFEDDVLIDVYLEGDLPAGFKRLKDHVGDLLKSFRGNNSKIQYRFIDPNEGTVEEVNGFREKLKEQGIAPTNLRIMDKGEQKQMLIYPVALVSMNNRYTTINLLENEVPGVPPDEVLNSSSNLLEYKFTNSFLKLKRNSRPRVGFLVGHGELRGLELADLQKRLRDFYNIGAINLDSLVVISERVDVLIIPRPTTPFPEQHKYLIDQYIMNGGRVLWMIDKLNVTLDSMAGKPVYIPLEYELKLDDMLYRYGARINANLILDLEHTRIPQVVGQLGNAAQTDMIGWYYHPLINPTENHPIVKNLDRIDMQFASTIDTIRTKTKVKKTILLTSSPYTRMQYAPLRLNFEILRYKPEKEKFNKGKQNVAVLLEGTFRSNFVNRVTPQMSEGLKKIGQQFQETSKPTRMIVVSDGDLARNVVRWSDGSFLPMGRNIFERYTFANGDFILNGLEYLLDNSGIMQARNKDVKLRMLDTVKAEKEKTKWQLINTLLPLVFLGLLGLIFNFLRKRRHTTS